MDGRPRARSTREMEYAISLEMCPECGMRLEGMKLRYVGDDTSSAFTGWCTRCGKPLWYTFLTREDPLYAAVPDSELGVGPSEILGPGTFLREFDRLVPLVHDDPTQLDVAAWKTSRDAHLRLTVTLHELAKLVPAGAASIPDAALSAEDRADRAARPERYTRAWIDEQVRHQDAIGERISADVPRIDKLEHLPLLERSSFRSMTALTGEALRAHAAWVKRGRTGSGRLRIERIDARGVSLGAVQLGAVCIVDTDLGEAGLGRAILDDAELTKVDFDGANLSGASLCRAKVHGGSWNGVRAVLAKLDGAHLKNVVCEAADLTRSQWPGADLIRCNLRRVRLANAQLDGAAFHSCDFRGADFSAAGPLPPSTTQGTRFENCDLRDTRWRGRDLAGAVFVRCKLAGITGTPTSIAGVTIENADLSAEGDRSHIANTDDVVAIWAED